jgi:hypothetical protein
LLPALLGDAPLPGLSAAAPACENDRLPPVRAPAHGRRRANPRRVCRVSDALSAALLALARDTPRTVLPAPAQGLAAPSALAALRMLHAASRHAFADLVAELASLTGGDCCTVQRGILAAGCALRAAAGDVDVHAAAMRAGLLERCICCMDNYPCCEFVVCHGAALLRILAPGASSARQAEAVRVLCMLLKVQRETLTLREPTSGAALAVPRQLAACMSAMGAVCRGARPGLRVAARAADAHM